MITSPTVSVLRNSTNPAWESGSSGEKGAVKISQLSVHNSVSPADPSRQASRLPIKVLKMLTARAGHLLHPEYLQPLPSTPVSPIEVSTSTIFCENVCAHGHQFAKYQTTKCFTLKSPDTTASNLLLWDGCCAQIGSITDDKQDFIYTVVNYSIKERIALSYTLLL